MLELTDPWNDKDGGSLLQEEEYDAILDALKDAGITDLKAIAFVVYQFEISALNMQIMAFLRDGTAKILKLDENGLPVYAKTFEPDDDEEDDEEDDDNEGEEWKTMDGPHGRN